MHSHVKLYFEPQLKNEKLFETQNKNGMLIGSSDPINDPINGGSDPYFMKKIIEAALPLKELSVSAMSCSMNGISMGDEDLFV